MSEEEKYTNMAQVMRETQKPVSFDLESPGKGNSKVLMVPKGMEPVSIKKFIDEFKDRPDRRTGVAKMTRLESFINHTNRFKSKESALFASCEMGDTSINASIKTIFDYHPEGPDNKDALNMGHSVEYLFPISKDFSYWIENNKTAMSQLDFALFLEERHLEMAVANEDDKEFIKGISPKFADPLEILELSRDLEIYSNESVRNKSKLSSGETEIKFSSEHVDAGGKPVKIPDFFMLYLPLFEGGDCERVAVRLRYRLKEGTVVWFYDLYRIDIALLYAFRSACSMAQEATELPLYYGEPE